MSKVFHSPNFISNLEKRDMYILMAAAKNTGARIHINNKAVDGNGLTLKDCVAVYSADESQSHSDLADMWIEYRELRHKNNPRLYYKK